MNHQHGMVTLMATSVLLLLTGMWGWLSFKSVMAETSRSQHQMYAAQALSVSEALLETAVAQVEQTYMQNGTLADTLLWANAKAQDCPTNQSASQWQCLQLNLTQWLLPEGIDANSSQIKLMRDVRNAPHKVILMVDVTLDSTQTAAGSRATVQQALFVPVQTPGGTFNPALWPAGIDVTRVQRIAGSWKNAGY